MKKIFTFIALFAIALFANAQPDNCAYFANSNVQVGADGTIDLMINADNEIGSIYLEYELPEGVTIKEITSTPGANININEELGLFLMGNNNYYTTGKVATFHVSVADNVEIGEYPITILVSKIVEPNLTTYTVNNIVASLTVQKTAVIEDQDPDYALEAVPFVLAKDAQSSSISVNLETKDEVAYISFDVEYPAGISPKKSGRGFEKPTINTHRLSSHSDSEITPLSAKAPTLVAGTTYHYDLNNDDIDTFKPNESGFAMHLPISLSGEVAEGVYTIKLTNISVKSTTDYETFTNHTGEYYVSVVVGEPSAQEAILYGHYSSSVASAFSTALKNVAIADVTAATVDEGAKFTDVLVNEKGGNSYYTRTSANYGTTVLPLDLTTDNADKLYTIKSMDSESIVLTEAEQVPANTPCIFKGTINVEGATPILGVPSELGLGQTTYKGTYEATEIASGAGYYISSDGKFYGDGATVRPFRGYFDGAIAGVKSLRVLLDDATGLIDITDQFSKEEIYNLQGIRMNNVQKGINIKGGKKILVK